ncbi:MAG: ComEC/Rec2 family competence protein, partial [Phocaeicola sp.]
MAAISFILLLFFLSRSKKYSFRGWFGIGASLFFLLLGAWNLQHTLHNRNATWIANEDGYHGFLVEPPIEKENSYAVLVEIDSKEVLLYLPKNKEITTWQSGEELRFYTTIQSPRNAGNPDEFDYARYLFLRGITGTAWVNEGCWEKGEHKRELTLVQRALKMRQKVVDYYRSWGIQDRNLAVLSALTVGEKEDITQEIRSSYAAAGLSHLLALSGLHVGILWGCITFLFRRFGTRGIVRLLRFILIISLLWVFSFVGGLTPSLVRAVIMCSLMELAALREGKVYSIHTLSIAAWVMLLYNPLYLFDVGFQLSFLAVLSILLLVPVFNSLFDKTSGCKRYLLQAASVSVAAQLGTAPISIYYFSIFP